MKRNILYIVITASILFSIFIGATSAMSSESLAMQDTMSAANELYAAGHYGEAVSLYQQLIDQGIADGDVHYNLANSQYQQGNTLGAIVNYQQAARLNPRDADIQTNLELALSQSPLPMPAQALGRIGELAVLTRTWLTVNELALLALGLWFLLGFLIIAARSLQPGRGRQALRYVTVVTMVLVFLSAGALGSRMLVDDVQESILTLDLPLAEVAGPDA